MKKRKILVIILVLNIIITTLFSFVPSNVYAAQTISSDINKIDDKKYPGVKSKIQTLQKQHPNWKFKVYYTGLSWDTVITGETKKHGNNIIPSGYTGNWVCPTCGSKTYSGGKWVCASTTAVKYMMDPRNSINYSDIFQFLELSYDSSTKYDSGVIKKILKGSFLDDGKLDTYIATIMNRCKEKNVNPYYVAVKIIQEQGTKGGSTFKMKSNEFSSEEIQLDTKNKVIKVVPNMTVKRINSLLSKSYTVKNASGKAVKDTDIVATGYKTNDSYTIVVLGDVNGDGKVKATDYVKIENYIMGTAKLDKYQILAADVNFDGKVKATDYVKIENYIMGTVKIKFDKVEYYYNIFNINATGSTVSAIISNALSWSKAKGWNTIEKCLIGGVDFIATGYISVGQNTLYFEKFDVIETGGLYSHQYAQDLLYAQNQGAALRRSLESINATEYGYTFVIPLFENMPSTACGRP